MKPGDLIHVRPRGSFLIRHVTGILVSSRFSKWSDTVPFHRVLTANGLMEIPEAHPEDWEVLNEKA